MQQPHFQLADTAPLHCGLPGATYTDLNLGNPRLFSAAEADGPARMTQQ
jgi:hypothetical protein